MERIKQHLPGLALCLLLSVPCWLAGQAFPIIGGPVFAILLGMVTVSYTHLTLPTIYSV